MTPGETAGIVCGVVFALLGIYIVIKYKQRIKRETPQHETPQHETRK